MGQKNIINCWYVYIHYLPNQFHKPFYIGIGCLPSRVTSRQNRSKEWSYHVKKFCGFYWEILHSGLTKEQAYTIEVDLILYYGRLDLKTGTLLNKNAGGQGNNPSEKTRKIIGSYHKGKIISEETRKRLSTSHIGQRAWNKGIPATPEQRARLKEMRRNQVPVSPEGLKRISIASKNRIWSEEAKQKISMSQRGYGNSARIAQIDRFTQSIRP